MSDLLTLTASEARKALDKGDLKARELTEAYLKAAEDTEELNAYVHLTPEHALKMADESDARLAKGEARPLEGIPIGVKDLFCTKDIQTTACSNILKGFTPPYESTVTQNLWDDGAVMLGKLNCDEFAMGSSSETGAFGAVISPWQDKDQSKDKHDYVAGGSSGGSAAAVAAHSALMATGTDTGGSIRQPAAFCGVVGLKPTYGRCSRYGIIAFASSLDQAGPITRNVEDAALMLHSMAGHDPKDSTSAKLELTDLTKELGKGIKGMNIGIPEGDILEGMDSSIKALLEEGKKWLEEAGANCIEIAMIDQTNYALPAYYIIAPAEASSNLARYDGVRYGERIEADSLDDMYASTRAKGFGDEVQRRILIGTYVLSQGYYDEYYIKAQKVRRLIQEEFKIAFSHVDLLLTPSTPTAAFPVGQKLEHVTTMYLNDVFTVPASLAGVPAISVPAGLNESGLPLGLQLIAPAFKEDTLIRAAQVMEQAADFTAIASRAAGSK